MTPEERERMNLLCLRIQEEKDYEKFASLLRELIELIERKERRFDQPPAQRPWYRNKPCRTVPAIVNRVVKPIHPNQSEKVEISIPTADELFREIRIENTLTDVDGKPVALKHGVRVDVTFEAEIQDTIEKATKPPV
jgi:hypothetical protein